MHTQKLFNGLELTYSDDAQYIVGYIKKDSLESGCAVKASGMNMMALATAIIIYACEKLKDEPVAQVTFLKAMIDTLKGTDTLDPAIDMAVSFEGKVLRMENE